MLGSRLYTTYQQMRESLWFVPALCCLWLLLSLYWVEKHFLLAI